MVIEVKIAKAHIFEASFVTLCVCKSVWGEWGCEWGPCPPIRNSFVTLCHFFLDLSFNLSATIFLSDCLALSQIVCISLSLSFVSLFFFVSLCVSCADVEIIYYAKYLFVRDVAHHYAYFLSIILTIKIYQSKNREIFKHQ